MERNVCATSCRGDPAAGTATRRAPHHLPVVLVALCAVTPFAAGQSCHSIASDGSQFTAEGFTAFKVNGTVVPWGSNANLVNGGAPPTGSGFTRVWTSQYAFVAGKPDGSIQACASSAADCPDCPSVSIPSLYPPRGQSCSAILSLSSFPLFANSLSLYPPPPPPPSPFHVA